MKSLIPFEENSTHEYFLPVYSCIKSSKDSDDRFSNLKSREVDPSIFKFLKNELCVKNGTGFCLAISLRDGSILYLSSTITQFLGYRKEMLLGQCLLNYLYPQDRLTLANQLTLGLQAHFHEAGTPQNQADSTFFCRIRQYHSLKFGFGVSDKKVRYKVFQFTTTLKKGTHDEDSCAEDNAQCSCLIATVTPINSAYKVSEEIPTMSSFSTRHTADCYFSHIDPSAIPYLGFLPQDMLGFSIFDFYHMDDMPQLKDTYELVVKEQGNSFRSKPYRFKVSNGNYIFLETEWSCFINPWSRKLEFVVGQHRVLKGPIKPNVFGDNVKEECVISDEILRESQRIQEEIKTLLSQPVKIPGDGVKRRCPKRKHGIASFVSNLVEEMCHGRTGGNVSIEQEANEECSCSDHGSVVMGEISPHQEYNGSNPSIITPESSQEIRYQDNIDRFFASQPKTYSSSDGSGESKNENCQQMCRMSSSYEGSGKNSVTDSGIGSLQTQPKLLQPVDGSQGSTQGRSSSASESLVIRNSLTEENLSQHNRLTQKYKQQQRRIKIGSSSNLQGRKEIRLKRVGSPENNKHNKNSKTRCGNTIHTQTDPECPNGGLTGTSGCNLPTGEARMGQSSGSIPVQTAGHIPMGPFSLNPPFTSYFPPVMSQASNMPWNNMATSASYNNPTFNPSQPSFGMSPQYCYMPGGNTGAPPTPFFMPMMCFGAMPFYPSIQPMVPHSNAGAWPSFVPNQQQTCPMPQDNGSKPMSENRNGSSSKGSSTWQPSSNSASSFNSPVISKGTENKFKSTHSNRQDMENHFNAPGKIKSRNNSQLKTGKPITSFSGTVYEQSSAPFTVMSLLNKNKPVVFVDYNKTTCISRMDDDSGYPHRSRKQNIQDHEQDSFSMASSSYLLRSDGFSSRSPSDRAEQDIEMEFKEEAEKTPPNEKPFKDETVRKPHRVPKDPPWVEGIDMTSEMVFQYQLPSRTLEEVLKKDMESLRFLTQPDLVKKQLEVLQLELEIEAEKNSESESLNLQTENQGRLENKESNPALTELNCGPSTSANVDCTSVGPIQSKKEVDLGFTTVEEDVGEELQAKENIILHIMCDNM